MRFKSLLTQIQAIGIPQELLSLNEEVEMSLDGLCVNMQLLTTSISHEMCCRTEIQTDGTEKKMLMNEADDMFQVCFKCEFHVLKLYCDKKI